MTVVRMLGRLSAAVTLTLLVSPVVLAHDRAEKAHTATGVSAVPLALPAVLSAGVGPLVDTAPLGGAVPWATIALPPVLEPGRARVELPQVMVDRRNGGGTMARFSWPAPSTWSP